MKKEEDVPCSITSSLEYFPQEEGGSKEEPAHPPQNPPTNLTVVTVEGCPSFVILDWEKPDNDTVTGQFTIICVLLHLYVIDFILNGDGCLMVIAVCVRES